MKKNSILILILFLGLSGSFNQTRPEIIWLKNNYKIELDNQRIKLWFGDVDFVEILSFAFNFIPYKEIELSRQVGDTLYFKMKFAEKDGYHPNFPDELPLKLICAENTFHFFATHPTFNHITITLRDKGESYFGLIEKLYPNNHKSPDLRGNVVNVEVYGLGNQDYAENYASAYSAFYFSSRGYGSFFDTFAKGSYKLGIGGVTEIYHQTGKLDWYIFYGPTGDKIHREYYKVIGKPKFVPIWACGPIFWRDENKGGGEELLNDIKKFCELKIPFTACFIDRPYSNGANGWSKMDFSPLFPDPEHLIREINNVYGLKLMTWVAPLTFSDIDFPGLLPGHPTYIDLTNPEALKEFERRLSVNQYQIGVAGHKMDRADQQFPLAIQWFEPTPESERRNKYIFLYAKVIDEFLMKNIGKENFNFARAAYHRCQPYLSAVWGGDVRSNWQGMAGNMANAIRCGFMGFPMWGNDTGGYLGEGWIEELLYIRWLQWSAWNGLFEIKIDGAGGYGRDRAPWKYSLTLQNVFREVCDLRMEMRPYIYSCVNTSYLDGVMMKPLSYLYPEDKNTYDIWDEYIFGTAFLVAPIFSESNVREVYFPSGVWYDFYDPRKFWIGPAKVKLEVPINRIPLFVRKNSIYVTGKVYQGSDRVWNDRLAGKEQIKIHLFPGESKEECKFNYIDYLDNNRLKVMELKNSQTSILFESPSLSTSSFIAIRCDIKPRQVINNKRKVDYYYNERAGFVELKLNKGEQIKLELIF